MDEHLLDRRDRLLIHWRMGWVLFIHDLACVGSGILNVFRLISPRMDLLNSIDIALFNWELGAWIVTRGYGLLSVQNKQS